jgi:phage FluMu protein Com
MITCTACGFESEKVEDFPYGVDQLRECPTCKNLNLRGMPGGIFPAQIKKAAERKP